MKKSRLKQNFLLALSLFAIASTSIKCGDSDDGSELINSENPAPNPNLFDKNNFVVTITGTDEYNPGDSEVYVYYKVKNLSTNKTYLMDDNQWDIRFKVKATDGFEFSNYVHVLTLQPEGEYTHGFSVPVSNGKTMDLNTLTYEIITSID